MNKNWKKKKALNVIIFNIPESKNPTHSALENCKNDLKIIYTAYYI